MNGVAFGCLCQEQVLRSHPGTGVIASSWTTCLLTSVSGVKQAIEAAGADTSAPAALFARFIAIEQAFAELKALLSVPPQSNRRDLWDAIAEIIELFTPTGMRQLLR